MRILAAGDLHGNIFLAKELAKKAKKENAELVVICGDIIDDDSTENILKPFKDENLKTIFVHGNHESIGSAEFLAYINKIKLIHGYGVRYQDVGFFGCGSANIGVHGLSEEEIFKTLEKAHKGIDYLNKKIMVTHVHPSDSTMEKLSRFVPGSTGVRDAMNKFKPSVVLCSHVHEAQGLEEVIDGIRLINVGPKGKIIDL